MLLDTNTLKRIRDMAALGNTPAQIAALLRVPADRYDAFMELFRRPDTEAFLHYMQGRADADNNINAGLARSAENGDVEAITLLDQRKQNQKVSELLSDLFGI